ncbi:MAG: PD-(D/E)XK nuclease family protein [Burkholderiales bacterium]|nr:PD-(D/E)XK nuclease family protein [Burkholderiales bacterium]
MLFNPELIPASPAFWQQAAAVFLRAATEHGLLPAAGRDYSALRVVVPTYVHAQLLLKALAAELKGNFIPPRIHTLFALLEMQTPDPAMPRASSASERLMGLYAELRQHAWLKKLFSARRNTDLLPLAQTLLSLSDELTLAMLPLTGQDGAAMQQGWQAALAQLPAPAQALLSEEAQLVWSVWQSQLDAHDPLLQRYQNLLRLAGQAREPLIWISPTVPDAMESAFLARWAQQQPVLPLRLDWRAPALPQPYRDAWPGLQEGEAASGVPAGDADTTHIRLCRATSLEDEALQGAQTVLDWLQAGKQSVAVIAQDRVVARRIRALLERAQVRVADETGWKLSTTRAAAALAAWFEVVASRADTVALLDLLKSPYLEYAPAGAESENKADLVMRIELILRRANVLGGWDAVLAALNNKAEAEHAYRWLATLARQANKFSGRRSLSAWSALGLQILHELSMFNALQADHAGAQIVQALQALHSDCRQMESDFSFAEWRALINLQLENTPFITSHPDKRVMMLPLNGARLRSYDAVLLAGADAAHLPSQPGEVLFFANAVRRECGLVTREARQNQQLRDFTELLLANPEVVLSWQGHLNGEHNPLSPWLAQLGLSLERNAQAGLAEVRLDLPAQQLQAIVMQQPRPSAPALLPQDLSASAYHSLVVCPYQFFAGRMLRLSAIDELSDMPEKRDYGDWLHAILKKFHDRLQQAAVADQQQAEQLLRTISQDFFETILRQSPSALGYRARWEKVIPAYVTWMRQREQDGWQFEIGEAWCEKSLSWDGGQINLRGRIDRIDCNAEGERAVLDYKTKNTTDLRKRLQNGEDHQLPFYGLLAEPAAGHASYVALEMAQEKTGDVAAADFEAWTQALQLAILDNMQSIQQGAALPAHGVESACQYCDMRGLCRKGAW